MESQYQRYKSRGLMSVMILMEDSRRGSRQVSPSYCNSYASKYGFTFPTVVDIRAAQMRTYVTGSIPVNMVITTWDMKIRLKMSGYSSRIESTISTWLSQAP